MKNKNQRPSSRRSARLAAVQALYQLEQTGQDVETILNEFTEHRFSLLQEEKIYFNPDIPFFQNLVLGVHKNSKELNELIEKHLVENWRLDRLPSVMRGILLAACYELSYEDIVPLPVILNEYIEISKEFFQDKEVSFVNGILDVISKNTRTPS
ncbi:MAG: transcription antitermination factor NusB [Alphaproteobacteria bacterium]|jgi:N utilization substance protein B|nr:transcription antitermination factor NusB [Alphaproteobacteria bacterium]